MTVYWNKTLKNFIIIKKSLGKMYKILGPICSVSISLFFFKLIKNSLERAAPTNGWGGRRRDISPKKGNVEKG